MKHGHRAEPFALYFILLAALFSACSTAVPLPPKAVELNRLGATALAMGDLPTAEARLALALEYSPKFTEAWVNMGLLELTRGNIERAKADLSRARDLNPDLPSPYHALGLLEEKDRRWKKAEARYREALKVDPGFSPSRENLGRILFGEARYDEAREQFLRLTEVAPGTLDAWVGLTESMWRLGRERDGDLAVDRARALFGDRPDLRLLVGRQLIRRRAFVAAEKELAPLTSGDDPGRRATAWAWIAVARVGEGRQAEATDAAIEALTLDPKNAVARYLVDPTTPQPPAGETDPEDLP
jgi:tetratricopeptide (TPR) repeat protein